MAFHVDGKRGFRIHCIVFACMAAALMVSGCRSGRASKNAEERSNAQRASDPGIDLNCVMDHIQNPPEAFHYSFKKQSSYSVYEEAEITPQTIDGSFKNNSASRTLHGVRSDRASWQGAWSGLIGIGGMSSAVALVRNASATAREGPEKVNGYDTIKYSIDTARGTPEEMGLYKSVLGAGGFEKGTAWVAEKGCPVKFVLDSELHSNDGNVEAIHYEVAMVRK